VHQDASAYVARLNLGTAVSHAFREGRGAYLYVIEGQLQVGDERLGTGDAAKVRDEPSLELRAGAITELLLVDVPLEGFETTWR
jgi:redox-sensitive bicupin YhaK (pirin superfamily)